MSDNKSGAPYAKGPAKCRSGQTDARILTDWRVSLQGRARQVRRLASIEQLRDRYGEIADLPPLPAGPVECPAGCCYCTRPWAVVA